MKTNRKSILVSALTCAGLLLSASAFAANGYKGRCDVCSVLTWGDADTENAAVLVAQHYGSAIAVGDNIRIINGGTGYSCVKPWFQAFTVTSVPVVNSSDISVHAIAGCEPYSPPQFPDSLAGWTFIGNLAPGVPVYVSNLN